MGTVVVQSVRSFLTSIRNVQTKHAMLRILRERGGEDCLQKGLWHEDGRTRLVAIY